MRLIVVLAILMSPISISRICFAGDGSAVGEKQPPSPPEEPNSGRKKSNEKPRSSKDSDIWLEILDLLSEED